MSLGAVKYGFKVAIAFVDTFFIYWAKAAFRARHSVEPGAVSR